MMNTLKKSRFWLGAVSLAAIFVAFDASAQTLPMDPWAVQQTPNSGLAPVQVQQVGPVVYGSQPYQPTYEGGDSNIWNTRMPEFTGEMTTWGTDYGQRATAPEVNMHNILSITRHLRAMGYEIPDTFESKVKAAPDGVRKRINKALNDLSRANDPFSKSAQFVRYHFENETGMTFDNLIGNSLDLISAK